MSLDTTAIRKQFPILRRTVRTAGGKTRPLTYLDHGASTHAPQPVIDAVTNFLSNTYANVHRGNHTLSQESSQAFEDATAEMARFIGANEETQPICLTGNTTQALDLAAHLMAGKKGVTLTTMSEHHSNDLTHRRRGKTLHADVDESGNLLMDALQKQLDKNRVKLLAVTGASNVTGIMPDLGRLARMAHDAGARILVDAAQLYAHAPIDVKSVDHPEHLDFVAAAGHKSYAPVGSAFLAAPADLIDEAPPHVTGGGTVEWVTADDVLHKRGPERHHGGTPNIVGAIAFAAATRWLDKLGMDNVREHEVELIRHGLHLFAELEEETGVQLLGPRGMTAADSKVGVFAFLVPGMYHGDASHELDRRFGIATRNGCFCAQPLLNQLMGLGRKPEWTKAVSRGEVVELPGAVRASVGIYNTEADLDLLAEGIRTLVKKGRAKPATTKTPSQSKPAAKVRSR